jgi:hypothetical protein
MNRKFKQDPITGHIKQSFADVSIGIPVAYALLIFGVVFLPQFRFLSQYLPLALALGVIGISASIWLNVNPNLWPKFLKFLSIVSFWTLISFRSFDYLFPNTSALIGLVIVTTVAIANTLPIWNTKITLLIRNELYSPKSQFGRFILKITFILLPLAGLIGASLQILAQHTYNKTSYTALMLGPLGWFLALLMPFATRHPISPWEYKNLKKFESE